MLRAYVYLSKRVELLPDDVARLLHAQGHASIESENAEVIEERGSAKFAISEEGDRYVLREMYEMGEGRSVYLVDIQPGSKVLDIGAHKGIFSIWAAKQGARVKAYEPDPVTFRALQRNIEINPGIDINAVDLGVWSERDRLTLYSVLGNSINSTFFPERLNRDDYERCATARCKVERFDCAIGDEEWDVVKIDAEQSEYEMLLSSNHLDQIRQLAFEWHCLGNERVCLELYRTVEKLSKFFNVPPIDLNWRALSMKRK